MPPSVALNTNASPSGTTNATRIAERSRNRCVRSLPAMSRAGARGQRPAGGRGARDVPPEREHDLVALPDEADELAPGALGLQLAEVDDPDPVAQALGPLHVMRRVQDGHTLRRELVHALEDRGADLRVPAG